MSSEQEAFPNLSIPYVGVLVAIEYVVLAIDSFRELLNLKQFRFQDFTNSAES